MEITTDQIGHDMYVVQLDDPSNFELGHIVDIEPGDMCDSDGSMLVTVRFYTPIETRTQTYYQAYGQGILDEGGNEVDFVYEL